MAPIPIPRYVRISFFSDKPKSGPMHSLIVSENMTDTKPNNNKPRMQIRNIVKNFIADFRLCDETIGRVKGFPSPPARRCAVKSERTFLAVRSDGSLTVSPIPRQKSGQLDNSIIVRTSVFALYFLPCFTKRSKETNSFKSRNRVTFLKVA